MAKRTEDIKAAATEVQPQAAATPDAAQDNNSDVAAKIAASAAAQAADITAAKAAASEEQTPAASESKPAEEIKTPAPVAETPKKAAAADATKKVIFTTDVAEAEGYVKQGYLVRHVHHEGVLGYKVFMTQVVNALGNIENVVSKA